MHEVIRLKLLYKKHILPMALLCLSVTSIAYAATWVRTILYDGNGTTQQNTEYFEVGAPELRFGWSFEPDEQHPESSIFRFYVCQKDQEDYICFVSATGNQTTNGTIDVHNAKRGTYYIRLDVVNVGDFEIWGIEDLDSRPEDIFGRFLAGAIGVVIIFVSTPLVGITILIIRRMRKKRQKSQEGLKKDMPLPKFIAVNEQRMRARHGIRDKNRL